MLNRDLLIIRFKQPFVDWINEVDPYTDRSHATTLESANEVCPVILIHEFASEEFESWLESCYQPLFDNILGEWYTDPALWPQDRNLEMFKAWCEFEVHSMVTDYVAEPLIDDDL